MFQALPQLAAEAVITRITLLANHVIGAEAVATERLRAHAGRCMKLHLEGWPSLLPPPPELAFLVTPAGLLEWVGKEPPPKSDLRVGVDASNPLALAAGAVLGQRPKIEVAGDAAFATDVSWLFDNLRWDIQDDLERLVGPGPAHEIARLGATVAKALREALGRLGAFGDRGDASPADSRNRSDASPPDFKNRGDASPR